MVIKVKLKREEKYVLLDHEVYESLNASQLFAEFKVFENICQHSSGVPVFKKYVAMISDGTKQIYLGTFNTAEEAAVAYNKKSVELFGVTPNLNKVNEDGMVIPFELSEEIKSRVRKQSARKTVARTVTVDTIS